MGLWAWSFSCSASSDRDWALSEKEVALPRKSAVGKEGTSSEKIWLGSKSASFIRVGVICPGGAFAV
jgi:hypothetical protein